MKTLIEIATSVPAHRTSALQRFNALTSRTTHRALTVLLSALSLAAVPLVSHAKLNVVTTTSDFAAIVREIGGDRVEITTLAKPTEDPHFVDAKPSYIVKLNKADVLIEGGAELESGWLTPLLHGARNARIAAGSAGHIAASSAVQLLEVPATLDRSKGDIHAAGNPHFMMDPLNAKAVADKIANTFSKLDTQAAATYRANFKSFSDRLDTRLAEWLKTLGPFQGRRVVAYHNSWPYFSARFGVKVDLFLEPKPGIPPTPTHLAEVIRQMKEQKVHVIFVEPYLNRKTAETVARKTGAVVMDVTQFPGGIKGTPDGYIQLIDYLVNSLAKALGSESN